MLHVCCTYWCLLLALVGFDWRIWNEKSRPRNPIEIGVFAAYTPERGGFEPPVQSPAHWFSKPAPSAARAPLHSQSDRPKGLDPPPSPQSIGRGPPSRVLADKRARQGRRSLPDSPVARQDPQDRPMIGHAEFTERCAETRRQQVENQVIAKLQNTLAGAT